MDTKALKTYNSDSNNKASISALKDTIIEFRVPDINFRGNNISYSADMKGKGIMIAHNKFTVKPKVATDKIEILDDLYGQSIAGKKYGIHKCAMSITTSIEVTCEPAAKTVEYDKGNLEQLAQVNTLNGIYTVFKGLDTAKPASVPLAIYTKAKNKSDSDKLELSIMDFQKDLGGKPDFISMGTSGEKATIFAGKGSKISKKEIDKLDTKSDEAFDIKDYIPSFKGKTCVPVEISKSDFYDE